MESAEPVFRNAGLSMRRGRPIQRRQRLLGLIFSVVLAAIVLTVAGTYLMPFFEQLQHLWVQRQISHQRLPAGTVIYTDDPSIVAQLKLDLHYEPYASSSKVSPPVMLNGPTIRRRYGWTNFPVIDAWDHNHELQQIDDTFCWQRRSSGGVDWIVALEQPGEWTDPKLGRVCSISQGAVSLAGWTPGSLGSPVYFSSRPILLQPTDLITLYEPQPDASDSSRILLDYQFNGRPGTISGIVRNDGAVIFSVASGPVVMAP